MRGGHRGWSALMRYASVAHRIGAACLYRLRLPPVAAGFVGCPREALPAHSASGLCSAGCADCSDLGPRCPGAGAGAPRAKTVPKSPCWRACSLGVAVTDLLQTRAFLNRFICCAPPCLHPSSETGRLLRISVDKRPHNGKSSPSCWQRYARERIGFAHELRRVSRQLLAKANSSSDAYATVGLNMLMTLSPGYRSPRRSWWNSAGDRRTALASSAGV